MWIYFQIKKSKTYNQDNILYTVLQIVSIYFIS